MENSHLDLVPFVSAFAGVIAGFLLTLLTSWYFSRQADKELEKTAKELLSNLLKDLPNESAKAIHGKNQANITVATLPLLVNLLTRQPVLDFIKKIAGFTNEEIDNSDEVLKFRNDLSEKVIVSLRKHRLCEHLSTDNSDAVTRNSVISFLEDLNENGITLTIKS